MQFEMLVVGGTYQMLENDDVRIELFGRCRDGRSATVRVTGFYPYFIIVEPKQSHIDELKKDPGVRGILEKDLEVSGTFRKCLKVTVKRPFEVPKYRSKYERYTQVLAADIPFVHRYYYDNDLSSCILVEGDEVSRDGYTTTIVVDAKKVSPTPHFKPQLKILSFDLENSIATKQIYTICCAIRNTDGSMSYESLFGDEKEMIKGLSGLIAKHDPDVITGYNIDGYDIPFLKTRAQDIKAGVLKWGRNITEVEHVSERFWRAKGRVIADAWWNVKREIHPKQETLNAVSKQLLGKEKLDVDRRRIEDEWAKDQEKVLEYCRLDAQLALEILEKIAVLEKYQDLAHVSKLPLDDVLNGRTSTMIDSIFIRECDRRNIGVPCTKHIQKDHKIEGGYVHEVDPGLYHWVCVLDFRSMYPSVIIQNNICFTTLSDKGEIVSPTGAHFLSPDKKKGLLPEILVNLMNQRMETKKKMKTAKSPEEKNYYDGLQAAIKILMNSFYGVFASNFYRFTDQRIGESITAFSRENIKKIISQLESEGIKVIYSDTDSVFFLSPEPALDKAKEFGEGVAKRFSEGAAVLEFEKIMEPFFTHGKKKRYVGKMVWPREEMIVRGYETRRTDSFDLQSESLNDMFEMILSDRVKEAVKYAKEIVKEIATGKVPLEKLVISKSVQDEASYATENISGAKLNLDRLPNIQAARKLRAMDQQVTDGMKVSWVVTNGKVSPMEVEPYLQGIPFVDKPDYKYYAERLASTLARVTDSFGYDEKNLLSGSLQHNLFSSAFQTTEGDAETIEIKPKEKQEEKAKPKLQDDTSFAPGAQPRQKDGPLKKDKVNLDDFL